jgi:tryptophanyl-tRNA synthetase
LPDARRGDGSARTEERIEVTTNVRDRVLSGMRPTGKLHLGNYLGALDNWVRLQEYADCFFFVADWHALTTGVDNVAEIPENTIDMVADWLGAGLDPARSTLFIQSLVPEHAELHLLFSMVTPLSWLERVPTYKDTIEQLGLESPSYGFLGYPLLQAADILMYKPRWVPVGIDQVPHVELTREVARRFNNAFGAVFPEPDAKLTEIPKVPGTDGRKMSKSLDNAIYLSDSPEVIARKVKPMMTDPARKRRADPGNPEVCPVFDLHRIFTPEDDRQYCATGCRTAAIGCLDCKEVLLKHLLPALAPIRERRQSFAEKPAAIVDILHDGSRRARAVAGRTMDEVRQAVKLTP